MTWPRRSFLALAAGTRLESEQAEIDAAFPGGNIIVESVEGDTVRLRQDVRDTVVDWFYWCFRVRKPGRRNMIFQFTRGAVIGPRGPAASRDGGVKWDWLGTPAVAGNAFRYRFDAEEGDTRFSTGMPYLEANLRQFLSRYSGSAQLKPETLCASEQGRAVELLRLGRLDGQAKHRVLLTARHHACEMMASYALEGMMEAVLVPGADGEWLRRNAEFLVVPFMDKDGVENGDQGKARWPHDHNRDYLAGRFASVRALCERVPRWSDGRLRFALDLHCPGLLGDSTRDIYFVGGPGEAVWKEVREYSALLASSRRGSLPFDPAHNLPFGKGWNRGVEMPHFRSFTQWACALPGIRFACSVEIPYAEAGGAAVTQSSALALGTDMAAALRRYLERLGEGVSGGTA